MTIASEFTRTRMRSGATIFMAVIVLATAPVGAWAQTSNPPLTQSGPGAQPAKPTGGGPTEVQPAPQPPPEASVVLPDASGQINSAAPTMHQNCETAQPGRPGNASPDGKDDPCLRDPTRGDLSTAPQPSDRK